MGGSPAWPAVAAYSLRVTLRAARINRQEAELEARTVVISTT